MDDSQNKFKIHPENEYSVGLTLTGKASMGQSYLMMAEDLPEGANKNDYYLCVTVSAKEEKDAKTVLKNVKGLYALLSLNDPLKAVKDKIAFNPRVEGSNIIIEIGTSHEVCEELNQGQIPNIVAMYIEHGTCLNGTLKLGFNPIHLMYRYCPDIIETAYDISLTAGGDELLRYLLKLFATSFRKQADQKKDVIANKIAYPICDHLDKYTNNSDKIDFEKTYDRDTLKSIIEEYNSPFGGFEEPTKHLTKFQEMVKEFLETEVKKISEGFFGPYLKILDAINFNTLDIKFYSQLRMGCIFVTATCPEVNEYVRDNVLCYLKKQF